MTGAWHRTPEGRLAPGPYPAIPGYAKAARLAYDTDRAVPFDVDNPDPLVIRAVARTFDRIAENDPDRADWARQWAAEARSIADKLDKLTSTDQEPA